MEISVEHYNEMAERLTELEYKESERQWIPFSERPPEEEGMYLVTFDENCLISDEVQVSDAYWIANQWQYGVLESFEHKMPRLVIEPMENLKVTAWMPLPKPFKEVEE